MSSESFLEQIKAKIGFNPLFLLGGLAAAVLMVFFGKSETYITALTGIIFPCYMSLKAIESPDEDDDKQWCTYWVVFFLFILFELYFSFILHLIPFYFLIKLIFLIWLFFPTTQGATLVYEKVLKNLFAKYEKDLDAAVDKIGQTVSRGYDNAKNTLKEKQGDIISGAVNAASNLTK